MNVLKSFIILLFITLTFSCKKDGSTPETPVTKVDFTVSKQKIDFNDDASKTSFTVKTSLQSWSLSVSADSSWVKVTPSSGKSGTTTITVSVFQNTTTKARSTKLIVSAPNTTSVEISINQNAALYPSYNTNPIPADNTGMTHSATEIANMITLGWNIGNTMEATGGETAWGNPKVTNTLIALVKQNGFNAIRIPCSWNQYADTTIAKIDSLWLARVKQVVQYCVNNDMYVILNIHWDGGWLENHCTQDKQKAVNARQRAYWEQIATSMRDFDEHVLFASANEPNVSTSTEMSVLLSFHQTFVDAVRSTGGRNKYRTLIVQGPSTDVQTTYDLMNDLPNDSTTNRMMVEVHYYTPFNFTGMTKDQSWGNQFYYWGKQYHSTTDVAHNATWGEEDMVDKMIKLMKTRFINKGIPVIVGEFGASRRSSLTGTALQLHLNSRAHYLYYVAKQARSNGFLPFYWDAGNMDDFGSALFNRKTNTVFDQQSLDSLKKAVIY